jgi:hypothetical protein
MVCLTTLNEGYQSSGPLPITSTEDETLIILRSEPSAQNPTPDILSLAELSFAMYEASQQGKSSERIADTLDLPLDFVTERIEAARLCLVRH